jgi:hypothetical protein
MMSAWIWIASCTESPIGQTPTDSIAPPPLINVQAEELPGGAKITYDFPPNEIDISYVKGEYQVNGVTKVVRASTYDNYLIVEGLGSTDPIEITLYLVDHSENVSTPVTKKFTPLTPPFENIYESLDMISDWGGATVTWDNPLGIEIGVAFFTTDSTGDFKQSDMRFFASKEGRNSYRGFDSVEHKFGIQITDKWGNMTPVKEWKIIPRFEDTVDRKNIKQYPLPWDNTSTNGGGQTFDKMFDGAKITKGNNSWHTQVGNSTSKYGFTIPILFTVDLGDEYLLSRFMWWQGRYSDDFLYGHLNAKTFKVYGTNEIPADMPDDYWHEDWINDWTLLADCEIVKPSGLPMGTLSDEDWAAANAGHEFYVLSTPVRYIRFAVASTWVGVGNNVTIHEIEFYGSMIK